MKKLKKLGKFVSLLRFAKKVRKMISKNYYALDVGGRNPRSLADRSSLHQGFFIYGS